VRAEPAGRRQRGPVLDPDVRSQFNPVEGLPPILITVAHASNAVPGWLDRHALGSIGGTRHALDRGVAALAHIVAAMTGARVLSGTFSRLVIDLNRSLDDEDLIPHRAGSLGCPPFNSHLSSGDLAARLEVRRRFHRRIQHEIERNPTSLPTLLVDLHTFPREIEGGPPRDVDIGICVAPPSTTRLALLDRLRQTTDAGALLIQDGHGCRTPIIRGDQPHARIHPASIGGTYASARARPVTVEVCDDLVTTDAAATRVGQLLSEGIRAVQNDIASLDP
jgi:predicted N-formylglutamate amidohydrolase